MQIDIIQFFTTHINEMRLRDWIDGLSALLAPNIAVFAAYIAYQQWKTTERNRRRDLFELRYENLFKKPMDLLLRTIDTKENEDINIRRQKLSEFISDTKKMTEVLSKYRFLLPREVFGDLKYIFDKAQKDIIEFYRKDNVSLDDYKDYQKRQEEYRNRYEKIISRFLQIEDDDSLIGIITRIIKTVWYFFSMDKVFRCFKFIWKKAIEFAEKVRV